ncbi:MAG TPA: 23S rRNA (adenine(2503)-C(2))-methyltransferase RlmN [Candidatus Sulfotelmatobacter sp.]|nr:23S rRNA (adenine(2503)-C(2))-methyltransferase RlmN [Candidatus Sulfotelmatobacter sp.]
MENSSQVALMGMDGAELSALVESMGEPGFRVQQLLDAVYRQRVESLEQISTLPRQLRVRLAEEGVSVGLPRIEKKFLSQDGTVRYLIGCADGQTVETVWMPEGDGGEAGDGTEAGDLVEPFRENSSPSTSGAKARSEKDQPIAALKRCATQDQRPDQRPNPGRATICVSSQVGCAVDCQFCLTALLGVKRNLTAGEIVGQVCAVLEDQEVSPPEGRINLVFMGMGEPFLNYDNFMKAVRLLVVEVGVAESRMTVSTAGIVPRIHDFGQEAIRPKLAISLNASNEESRTQLMPLNRKWNLEKLMAAAREFPLRNRERITFEYVLLGGVNDATHHAEEVVELLRGMRCKVNLIRLNPGPGIAFSMPAEERVAAFQQVLIKAGIPAFVRRPRGRDIYAACGQLKRTVEIATAPAR